MESVQKPAGALAGPSEASLLVLGGDADNNLGDQAILRGVCHALKAQVPDVRITLVSALPWDRIAERRIPGVCAVLPRGLRHWPAVLACAARQSGVLLAGGGLLQDDDSRIKMPYWAARLQSLRLANPALVAVSVGAGPLIHAESRWFARRVADATRSLSVRDQAAAQCLQTAIGRQVAVVPDPAFLLPVAESEAAEVLLARLGIPSGTPLIGVTLRRWFHVRGGVIPHRLRGRLGLDRGQGAAAMQRCLDQFASALQILANGMDGARLLLLPSYPLPHEGDLAACHALAQRLPKLQPRISVIRDAGLYKAVCGRLSLMISARMHPLILAASMGTPIVGLGYNQKFDGLFRMLDLPGAPLSLGRLGVEDCVDELVHRARGALVEHADIGRRAHALAERADAGISALLPSLGLVEPAR